MLKMSIAEKAWCAGVLSCFGVLTLTHHAHPCVRLQMKSSKHKGMIKQLGRLTGVPVKHKSTGDEVDMTGETLAMFWSLIDRFVTHDRIDEYVRLFEEAMKRSQAYDDKKAYEAERASTPNSSPETLRHRAEALYHNQDSAVQVVEGFVEAEMATTYDLEQARIAREKAQAEMTKGFVHKRGKR
jgi:hypothetical protein